MTLFHPGDLATVVGSTTVFWASHDQWVPIVTIVHGTPVIVLCRKGRRVVYESWVLALLPDGTVGWLAGHHLRKL